MELVAVYIKNFKGLFHSFISLNSKFESEYKKKRLRIKRIPSAESYYHSIPSTLIVGRNGAGKTTLLEFIENFNIETSSSGFMVWFNQDRYEVVLKNYAECIIASDMKAEFKNANMQYYIENRLFTVKINNNLDFYSHLFRPVSINIPHFLDLSLAAVNLDERSKSNEINKILKFANSDSSVLKTISNKAIKFKFTVELYNTLELQKIIKGESVSHELKQNLLNFFQKKSNDYYNGGGEASLEYNYEFVNRRAFEGYIQARNKKNLSSIFAMMFDKNGYSVDNLPSKNAQIFNLVPKLLQCFISDVFLYDGDEANYAFALLLIGAYFSTSKEFVTHVKVIVSGLIKNDEQLKRLPEALDKLKRNFSNLLEVITMMPLFFKKAFFVDSRIDYFIKDAKDITRLISLSRELESVISDVFYYQWQGLSSGQISTLHFYARLYDLLEKFKRSADKRNAIILIDEIDLYLHPELQRTIFSQLLDFLIELRGENNYQLILTTHSPLIASDFLPQDIISIKPGRAGNIIPDKIKNIGFGSTISDYMIQGFFLNATIGDRSLKKIKELLSKDSCKYSVEDEIIISSIVNGVLKRALEIKNDSV
ncbi:AAA family ATPase [Pantoea agglomerans]|uniref:AAA family ATPase n=1 Tax=Enterobacter agglomerans TaxID=549 RepID=UPI00320893E6